MRALSILIIALSATLAACASPGAEVRTAIAERLALMDDVARYKWNEELPITDEVRESQLLMDLTATAESLGLEREFAQRVLRAQMAAARLQQEWLIATWRAQDRGPFDDVPDLGLMQRPAITIATTRLLTTLRRHACSLTKADSRSRLDTPPTGIHADAWATATAALFPPPAKGCETR